MTTKIYPTYSAFCARENEDENGVSPDFAASNPEFEKRNETNRGCSDCYDCYDKKETTGTIPKAPKIENIHASILAAVEKPGALDMSTWHTCDTTHCRAGWVVTLAGKPGKELEQATSTLFAAMQIYHASSPLSRCRRCASLRKTKKRWRTSNGARSRRLMIQR